ncbi:MAG TPA: acyl carrier protein [Gemmatimonadales bacterium]|nr:acyl carrier protein [Gemmatimonadales bacterium]
MTTLNRELASFIEKNLIGEGRGASINDATPLIEEGIVDSMGLMQIVAFLEERTGVRVPDDEISPDNFETIELITRLVEKLQAKRAR